VTCIFVFLAYRYLLSSSDAEVENPQQRNTVQKVKFQKQSKMSSSFRDREADVVKPREQRERKFVQKEEQKEAPKQAKTSSSNVSDSRSIPASELRKISANVLRKMDDVTVLEKTANFTVREQVRLVAKAC